MSTHSDEYFVIKDTIEHRDTSVKVFAPDLTPKDELTNAINHALHNFVNTFYMDLALPEVEADELHLLIDKEVPHV